MRRCPIPSARLCSANFCNGAKGRGQGKVQEDAHARQGKRQRVAVGLQREPTRDVCACHVCACHVCACHVCAWHVCAWHVFACHGFACHACAAVLSMAL